jgi:hypothetical protein
MSAVAAPSFLLVERMNASRPKLGHVEEPSLGWKSGWFGSRRAFGVRAGTQRIFRHGHNTGGSFGQPENVL